MVLLAPLCLAPGAAPADAVWSLSRLLNGTGGFVIVGTAGNAGLGLAGAGDVNGDGLGDIAIGAPKASTPGGSFSGRSYVVFGKNDTTNVWLGHVATGTGGFQINGEGAHQYSGTDVAGLGDVNGDGLADIAVVAPSSSLALSNTFNQGFVYVVFGRTSTSLVHLSDVRAGTGGFAVRGPSFLSGASLSSPAGDLNADGLGDFLVGAGNNAYFVYGKTSGTQVELSAVAAGTGGFQMTGGGITAMSLAGDVNGDGVGDWLLGMANLSPLSRNKAGECRLVFGQVPSGPINLMLVGGSIPGLWIPGAAAGDYTGCSVSSAGDINGDGLADIVVGARRALAPTDPYTRDPGRAYVIHGVAGPYGGGIVLSSIVAGTEGFAVTGHVEGEELGTSVTSLGDCNGDGLTDLLLGAPKASDESVAAMDFGRSYHLFGRTATTAVQASQIGVSVPAVAWFGDANNMRSGQRVANAGDIDGDGLADLLISAPYAAAPPGFPGGIGLGRIYVALGGNLEFRTTATWTTTLAAGDRPRTGIGTHRQTPDATTLPDSWLWIDYPGGSNASTETIARALGGVHDYPLPSVAGVDVHNAMSVLWQLTSTRADGGSPRVAVRYPTFLVETFPFENRLRLCWSTDPFSGSWSLADVQVATPGRNEISGVIPAPGLDPTFLALIELGPPTGDTNNDDVVNVADLTDLHNYLAGITGNLDGNADVDNDADVDGTDAAMLADHLVNGTPLP